MLSKWKHVKIVNILHGRQPVNVCLEAQFIRLISVALNLIPAKTGKNRSKSAQQPE